MTNTLFTPLLIDSRKVQALLGISPRKLWSLTNCNAIPHKRIGRSVRYDPVELKAWMDAGCATDSGAAERVRAAMRKGVRQ
jgi:predicted DNA-binding transcriptional regulator AlpA